MNTFKPVLFAATVFAVGLTGCSDSQSIVGNKPAASTTTSTTSAAPATTTSNSRSAKFLARLKADLGLTDDQVTKVQALMDKSRQAMQQAKSTSASVSSADFHKTFAENRKNFESQLTAILTPAQQAKFASLRQERMSKMKNPDPATVAAREAQHLAKLKADLSLTDAQVTSIKALHETMRQQIQQNKTQSATTAASATATSKESRRQLHAELFKAYQTQFEAILTADQKAKFEQIKAQHQQNANYKFHNQLSPVDK
jgi:Spy/CpxP family protein refolding chaperone